MESAYLSTFSNLRSSIIPVFRMYFFNVDHSARFAYLIFSNTSCKEVRTGRDTEIPLNFPVAQNCTTLSCCCKLTKQLIVLVDTIFLMV